MLFIDSRHSLPGEQLQVATDALAGRARLDNVVHVSAHGGRKRVGKRALVIALVFGQIGRVAAIENRRGAFCAHYGHFGGRPRVVDVGAQVLARHDVVCAAVGLACNHSDLRHGRFRIRVEQFGAVSDNAVVFLSGACE